MTLQGTEERDVDWAVALFRPLLKDLRIQRLADLSLVFTANYKAFKRHHIDRCVVVVKRFNFSKPNYKGVFIWQYNQENDIFALYIILNDNMYSVKNPNKVYRKAVSTHEFTHCVAALLTISRLKTKVLIENQQKKLSKQFHALEESDVKNLMADISASMIEPEAEHFLFFPDAHFRTGDEDFSGKYSELYRNLLFSYELFKEYFTDNIILNLRKQIKENKEKEFSDIISQNILKIIEDKHLDKNFVIQRFKMEFAKKLIKELR